MEADEKAELNSGKEEGVHNDPNRGGWWLAAQVPIVLGNFIGGDPCLHGRRHLVSYGC